MPDKPKTFPELCEWLESAGWIPGRVSSFDSYSHVWYRRYPEVEPRCYCNDEKRGVQIALKAWDNAAYSSGIRFEVELRAEPDDGVWVRLVAYTLSGEDVIEKLDAQVAKLIRAWRAVQTSEVTA